VITKAYTPAAFARLLRERFSHFTDDEVAALKA
jgi:hypothetical protein